MNYLKMCYLLNRLRKEKSKRRRRKETKRTKRIKAKKKRKRKVDGFLITERMLNKEEVITISWSSKTPKRKKSKET